MIKNLHKENNENVIVNINVLKYMYIKMQKAVDFIIQFFIY